jgi:hypothetical protein
MFDCVPLPVIQTFNGKWGVELAFGDFVAAWTMGRAASPADAPSSALACAQAFFSIARQWTISSGIRSGPMLKMVERTLGLGAPELVGRDVLWTPSSRDFASRRFALAHVSAPWFAGKGLKISTRFPPFQPPSMARRAHACYIPGFATGMGPDAFPSTTCGQDAGCDR